MGFEPIKKKVILSIDNPDMSQHITIKQGFIGTLELTISFLYQKETFILPPGTTAKLRMLKPDKSQVLNNFEVVGNSVIVSMTFQMQRSPGIGSFEIILMNEGDAIPSSTCNITITPSVHDDSNIQSTDEYISVIEALVQVNEALSNAETVTDNMNDLIDLVQSETLKIYKNYVNTYANIATTYPNPEIGWITKTIDTGNWYRYNGAAWVIVDNDTLDKVGNLASSTNTNKSNVIAITNELNANKLNKTGDAKDNTITFSQAAADGEMLSGSTLSVLFGLIKKKFADIVTTLAGKLNTANVANNDVTTAAGFAWDARRGKAIRDDLTTLNNNLTANISIVIKTSTDMLTSLTTPNNNIRRFAYFGVMPSDIPAALVSPTYVYAELLGMSGVRVIKLTSVNAGGSVERIDGYMLGTGSYLWSNKY